MQRNTSSTVEKAFAILELVHASDDAGVSLGDVAERLDIAKSTAHRYLTTLEELDVVQRDHHERFHIGYKLVELGSSFLTNNDLRDTARPYLEELSRYTRETIHLAVPSDDSVIYIARIDGSHSVRVTMRIGERATMHSTALGKAMLAYMAPREVEEILSQGLPPRTPYTITEKEALLGELLRIRAQGYAVDEQEYEIGVRCVGAPIVDVNGIVIGALSVAGPASRLAGKELTDLAPKVSDAALQISRRMGHVA